MQKPLRMHIFYSGDLKKSISKGELASHDRRKCCAIVPTTRTRVRQGHNLYFEVKCLYVIFKNYKSCLRLTIWSANISTVFNENFLPQYTKRSSRLGPSKSRTSTLSSPSIPDHFMLGIPPTSQNLEAQSNPNSNCYKLYEIIYRFSHSQRRTQTKRVNVLTLQNAYFLLEEYCTI